LTSKFNPRVATMDAVEYSIMNNINFMRANYNITIPSVSGTSGNQKPYQGFTNVNGYSVKYNVVQANGVLKVSDYMIH
jgi:hypothetical protein